MPDLTGYNSVRTHLFISIDVPTYGKVNISDYDKSFTIGSETYTNIGDLLDVTASSSEIRASKQEVTVTISGLPPSNVSLILNNDVKGSAITIKRAFFDVTTGALISISGNPMTKFKGAINNFGLIETIDNVSHDASFEIALICTSAVGLLMNKRSGRRTNPQDEQSFYPTDESMDRVPAIINSSFNFGAPLGALKVGTK